MFFGGQRETRTLTVLLPQDFESCASTSSAIRPCSILVSVYAISYQLLHKRLNEYLLLCLHAPVLLQYTRYKESNYLMNLIVEVQNSETTKVSNHCVFVIQLESSSFNDCSTRRRSLSNDIQSSLRSLFTDYMTAIQLTIAVAIVRWASNSKEAHFDSYIA